LPDRPHRNVGIAAQAALLHATRGNAQVDENLTQLLHVEARLQWAAHIWLADNLHQGGAGTVDIHQAIALVVQQARRILLQVDAGNADAPLLALIFNSEITVPAERNIILRDLITFHQVRIRIVLAIKFGVFGDGAVEGKGRHNGVGYRLLVDDG
jgi:hypothetical protein